MTESFTPMRLAEILDGETEGLPRLRRLGLVDVKRGYRNLLGMAESGITLDLLASICERLSSQLPSTSDADMSLNNLERFVRASRSPLALGSLFERDPEALPILLQMFSTSQHQSDVLIEEPEIFDLLRITEGTPVARDVLVEEFLNEVRSTNDERTLMAMLRSFKRRETARIAYGDIVRGQRLETVTRQISHLADAICESAVLAAKNLLAPRYGTARRNDGEPARFAVLALGKLGGVELNYSSDIDLMFLYDEAGRTDGQRAVSNQEYFDRLARRIVKLLTENTSLGVAYRVDLRLRPEGAHGPMVMNLVAARRYYDVLGRTWERQAFIKARCVAGDAEFGHEFLRHLEPWIYQRYLTRADITGIKALKRRIERRAREEGGDQRDVKTGHGGIRDIEFVIQFLQLLNGGELPGIRTGNTLEAIALLEKFGCLNMQEGSLLAQNYTFLRKIEHRLQIMFDLQTHTVPSDDQELRKLAIRMGYTDREAASALVQFKRDLREGTAVNRKILDHLLHDAFADEEEIDPAVDLVLDPTPSPDEIDNVLARHGFRDVPAAYRNLMALSTEPIPFLSTRRCRHFLAAIAPKLLRAISHTPDPDAALVSLAQVSDSVGGKGVLWELLSTNPASLNLYVRLCASSPYLSNMLTSNPGMIDELMDSLLLDRLPSFAELHGMLADLCRGAEDIEPILHNFKNTMHLRVGVRDILGKDDILKTHATLSDVAEVCLQQITLHEYQRLVAKYGVPKKTERDVKQASPRRNGQLACLPGGEDDCELITLGLGKLGGREPNYHSDLDVIFIYEDVGHTQHSGRKNGHETTSNQHFFSELGQRVIKFVTRIGPFGRLYDMDPRLRPNGKSGALAVSLAEFRRYFDGGSGQLWERQALCKARPVFGSAAARRRVMDAVQEAIVRPPWRDSSVANIHAMRRQMEATASPENLKRGPGGTVDIEFAVQMLQLRHAAEKPQVLVPGTLAAIEALRATGCLSKDDAEYFSASYRFLRSIEARLRLMNTAARHDLPEQDEELGKLAYLMHRDSGQSLLGECRRYTTENRERFHRLFATAVA